MSAENVKVRVEGSGELATICLDRPEKLNAMDFDTFDQLASAVAEVRIADPHVVVVRAEGRAFSAGIDVGSFGSLAGDVDETIARAQAGFRALAALPMPTVAAVQGHALGAGAQLALACDLRIAADDLSFGLLEMRYGLIPDLGGSTKLPQLVGAALAKEMIWLQRRLDAQRCLDLGLVHQVVPATELEAAISDLTDRLTKTSRTALRASKRVLDDAHRHTTSSGMDAEAAAQAEVMQAPDFAEALMKGLQQQRRA